MLLQKVRKKDLHPKCPDHPLAPKRVEHFLETGTWFLATLLHPQKVAKMEQLLLQTSIGFSVWQKPTALKVRKEDLVAVKAVQATSARQEAVS